MKLIQTAFETCPGIKDGDKERGFTSRPNHPWGSASFGFLRCEHAPELRLMVAGFSPSAGDRRDDRQHRHDGTNLESTRTKYRAGHLFQLHRGGQVRRSIVQYNLNGVTAATSAHIAVPVELEAWTHKPEAALPFCAGSWTIQKYRRLGAAC